MWIDASIINEEKLLKGECEKGGLDADADVLGSGTGC